MTKAMENKFAVAALSALAFETRLRAVQLLASVGEEGIPAGQLAERLGVQQNTMSDHLRALSQAEIVTTERRSRSVIYRVNPSMVADLAKFLEERCTPGSQAA
ncbi:MAG: metalloregulator ArsR/SmtB family transcription factor [Sphingomonadaceae bacterium]